MGILADFKTLIRETLDVQTDLVTARKIQPPHPWPSLSTTGPTVHLYTDPSVGFGLTAEEAAQSLVYGCRISDACPRCGADLIDVTAHGDCEPSYECGSGHWFYGKEHTDGITMFGDAPRWKIIEELNEAHRSASERRLRINAPHSRRSEVCHPQPATGSTQRLEERCPICGGLMTTVALTPTKTETYCFSCSVQAIRDSYLATGPTQRLERHCPACNDALPDDANHCIQCGTRVR